MTSQLDQLPPTLTVEHTGELLGISRGAAYRAATAGQIPTIRIGRRLLVPTARLLGLLGHPPATATESPTDPTPTIKEERRYASELETRHEPAG